MLCPVCHSVMRCISEIHNIPDQPGKQRMDLHCFNREDNNERKPNRCRATCHMGVITNDPNPWQCHDYSFQLYRGGESYILHSHDYSVNPMYQGNRLPQTTVYARGKTLLHIPSFMPISTGDDMHKQAYQLLDRLLFLVDFS